MEIAELITLGRLSKQVRYGNVTIHLTTPSSDDVEKAKDNIDLVSLFITKINDKTFDTKEEKEGLKSTLKSMQSAVVGNVVQKCTDLLKEQESLIEEMSKK